MAAEKVNMEFLQRVADWTAGNWQALVGYGASVVILVSLVTANVLKLRLVNGIGSLLFGWYGLLIGSWPVCIINWMRFKEAGVRAFVAEGAGRQQVKYDLKNGFRRVEGPGGGERYVLEL